MTTPHVVEMHRVTCHWPTTATTDSERGENARAIQDAAIARVIEQPFHCHDIVERIAQYTTK